MTNRGKTKARILKLLSSGKRMALKDITYRMKRSETTVHQHLYDLVMKGQLRMENHYGHPRYYKATP